MDFNFFGISIALFILFILASNVKLWFYRLALLFVIGLLFLSTATAINIPLYYVGYFFVLITAYFGVIKIVEVLKIGK